ncbi:phage gene 29 protein family protein [Rhodococcoides fascians]|uniref:phage gene 29 protein family protein n=1 Tax=Rhodococcoides fascians TaxID=1828 RepID=UPI000691A439|nr:DUF2744 domain-containing protein [Rhodococcus fascians]
MLPMQGYCDPDDPEEFALWALIGIAETPGVPMLVPEEALRGLSKQLYEAGFRHQPELQRKKAVIEGAPEAEGVSWMGVGQVVWTDIDKEDSPVMAAAIEAAQEPLLTDEEMDQASAAQLIAIKEKLEARGVVRPPEAPTAVDGVDEAVVSTLGGD